MSEPKWIDSLITPGPQEGFELAIKLARMGVKYTQPDGHREALGAVKETPYV